MNVSRDAGRSKVWTRNVKSLVVWNLRCKVENYTKTVVMLDTGIALFSLFIEKCGRRVLGQGKPAQGTLQTHYSTVI